jgi:hypothetical protein
MKRELDPFESKLKEKLQGKASFPEYILWKRLNDELLRSDKRIASKNRYWFLGTAFLVLLSLSAGYWIGARHEVSKQVAKNGAPQITNKKALQKRILSSSLLKNEPSQLAEESSTIVEFNQSNLAQVTDWNSKNTFTSSLEKTDRLSPINVLSEIALSQNYLKDSNASRYDETSSNALSSDIVDKLQNETENNLLFDKLTINKASFLLHSTSSLAKGSPHHKIFPLLLSATLGFEPTSYNRVESNRIYDAGSNYSNNEKGLTTMNVRFGFQAQLGRHLELGIGLGTSAYLTQQTLQNQVVEIDPLAENLNFESSISSFQIHENHLQDDPEDQEENELNFQDSTSFHLNYQISNSIKSIQVPITAGFVFNWNNWKLTMKTGLIYNHITQANQVLNINGFKAIRNDVASQLVSNSYFHLIQLGAEYPVSEHFTILLAPKYSYALKSISKSTVLRPNALGLECALKFYF